MLNKFDCNKFCHIDFGSSLKMQVCVDGLQHLTVLIKKLFRNNKDDSYKYVQTCFTSYRNLGCNMSIKVHFLFNHLENFTDNLGDVSDEQRERFHQDMQNMKERYQERWGKTILFDYCWSMKGDDINIPHRRKASKRKILP